MITFERSALADDGLWLLAADRLDRLPAELSVSHGAALVATSGQAKRAAIKAGHEAAQRAVGLGPSEPAFRSLVGMLSDSLRPALFRGAHLKDPTSITDYTLFCFESKVTEGNGRREVTWSYLVRADQVGARPVSWELLANIEPDIPHPKAPHPASMSDATSAAEAAAGKDATDRRRALEEWLSTARTQLEQLPNDLTDEIADKDQRINTRNRIKSAVSERLKELGWATNLDVGDVELVGWAHVTGSRVPPDPTEKDSELIAMTHVAALLRDQGWAVADVHTEKPGPGFDLHALKGRNQRCVEVKGVQSAASSTGVTLTGNELAKAGLLGDDYWLYVVDGCGDGTGALYAAYQNPVLVFADATRDVPILHINGSDLKRASEELVG